MTTTVAKWVVVGVAAVSVGLLAWTRQGRPPAPTSAGLALFSVEGVPASLRLYGGESVTVDLTVTSRTDMPLDIRVAEVSGGCTEAQLSVQRLARRGDRAVLSVKLDSSTIAETHDISDDGRIHVILRRSEFTKPGSRQRGKIRFGLLSPSTQAQRTVVLTWQAL